MAGLLNWSYDGVGNRTAEALSPGYSNTYNYAAGNNRLASLTQGGTTVRAFSYDGAGNLITDSNGPTTYNYAYNNRGRLATLTVESTQTSSYFYDGLERLAIDASPNLPLSGITQYVYDQAGHLLAESDDTGSTLTEYVWLDDMPIALVANVNTSPSLYFVHADHLDRPIRMTDGGENVVWDAVYNPFGGVNSITGSAVNNLRFPGQYFLMEDGLHYNWYRHYDPTIGRYIQLDPLGFIDGPSLYPYANSDPLQVTDPEGKFGILGGILSAVADVATQVALNYHRTGDSRTSILCVDVVEVAVAGIAGIAFPTFGNVASEGFGAIRAGAITGGLVAAVSGFGKSVATRLGVRAAAKWNPGIPIIPPSLPLGGPNCNCK